VSSTARSPHGPLSLTHAPLSLAYDALAANRPGDDLLNLRVAFAEGTFLITVYGEMDLSNAEEFEQLLRQAEASDARQIVVDLSALHFIDSTGIKALFLAAERSRADGNRLAILRGPDEVERAIDLCGLADLLPFLD
jgi:anti-sigma B factor antagonist